MITMQSRLQTRNGHKVRLLCVDAPGDYPVVGLIEGAGCPDIWTADGRRLSTYTAEHPCDLIPIPPPRIQRTVWLNVYRGHDAGPWHTRDFADRNAGPDRIACIPVPIDVAEGEQ